MPFRADLHCHSTRSDGTVSPQALLQLAEEMDLQGLSITDHDTLAAYQSPLESSIELIYGVEFSATIQEKSAHILGYAFALQHPALQALCSRHSARREERNREILRKLAALKMPISLDEISSESSTIGRPHIALAMMQRGYVSSIQEAFKRYIGDGRPAFARGEPISVEETLAAIHAAGGAAIIAHPHLIEDPALLRLLLEMPFDGIECFYARFPADSNEPWASVAQKRGWLATGGSDFHGENKPGIALGSSWTGEETFRTLQNLQRQNNPKNR